MNQLTLGLADRHAGQAAALAAATDPQSDYRHRVEAALAECIRSKREFTADDIRRRIGDCPDERVNVLPSAIGRAAREGLIVDAGEYRSPRRSRHGNRNRVWISREAARD